MKTSRAINRKGRGERNKGLISKATKKYLSKKIRISIG